MSDLLNLMCDVELKKITEKADTNVLDLSNLKKTIVDSHTLYTKLCCEKELYVIDIFCLSVINRSLQSICSCLFCYNNGLLYPLVNNLRQLIELIAINSELKEDIEKLELAIFSEIKPNIKKDQISEDIIRRIYGEFSTAAHSNKGVLNYILVSNPNDVDVLLNKSPYNTDIPVEFKKHVLNNLAGFLNRINIFCDAVIKEYDRTKDVPIIIQQF